MSARYYTDVVGASGQDISADVIDASETVAWAGCHGVPAQARRHGFIFVFVMKIFLRVLC